MYKKHKNRPTGRLLRLQRRYHVKSTHNLFMRVFLLPATTLKPIRLALAEKDGVEPPYTGSKPDALPLCYFSLGENPALSAGL